MTALLLDKAVDTGRLINQHDSLGRTALHLAADKGHFESVDLLLLGGADVNVVDDDGRTPLYRAARRDHANCVKLLVEADGVELNKATSSRGLAPLHIAACCGHVESVRLLIEAGGHSSAGVLDVNQVDRYGQTPLFWAARFGRSDCVQLLIQACEGCVDVNLASDSGHSPLSIAVEKRHPVCVQLLTEAGGIHVVSEAVGKAAQHGHHPSVFACFRKDCCIQ
jgi:ankyrin repeat protein